MPFTFSHPAIVLPLYRLWPRWLSLTGLVAGSIVPDFEYFIRLKVYSNISHTIPGLFLFDLPLGLLLALLFQEVVRKPLILHLPAYFRKRFGHYIHLDWVNYLRQNIWVVACSVIVGAFSHQFWDGFTHRPEFFVERISALRSTVLLAGQEVELYRIIQHSSSVAGALVIGVVVHRLPPNAHAPVGHAVWWYWPLVLFFPLLLFVFRIAVPFTFHSLGNIAVALISGFLLGLVVASVVVRGRYAPE